MTAADAMGSSFRSEASLERPVRSLTILAGLVVIADILLFGHPPGVSVTLFLIAVFVAAGVANAAQLAIPRVASALVVLSAALAPSVESFGFLSALFGMAGAALAVRVATGRLEGGVAREALATAWVALAGPVQALVDAAWVQAALRRSPMTRPRLERLLAWCAPVGLGLVFVLLFRAANPVIDDALARLDLERMLASLNAERIAFWVVIAAACWSFIFVGRYEPRIPRGGRRAPTTASPRESPLLGHAAALRSLAAFNIVFAVQTVMDVAYLWAGASLPEGVTYAAYAHRGAYALLATALLSGAFMLLVMRPGTKAEESPLVRILAYAWMAQNVLLVASAIRRLALYVEAYALTHLRVAALVWMGLVAVGLVLIAWRIAFRKSAVWLVCGNAAALAATLYACSFVSFDEVIARYNVAHSRELGGNGPALDVSYLCSLGPDALPGIDRAASHRVEAWVLAMGCAHSLRARFEARPRDWRSWTDRRWRLARYLEDHPYPPVPAVRPSSGAASPPDSP